MYYLLRSNLEVFGILVGFIDLNKQYSAQRDITQHNKISNN